MSETFFARLRKTEKALNLPFLSKKTPKVSHSQFFSTSKPLVFSAIKYGTPIAVSKATIRKGRNEICIFHTADVDTVRIDTLTGM